MIHLYTYNKRRLMLISSSDLVGCSSLSSGSLYTENGQNFQFFVLCSKNVLRYEPNTSQSFRGLAALELSKNGGEQMGSGGGQKKLV